MKLTSLSDKYKSEFPSNWINSYDWSTEEFSKRSYSDANGKIEKFANDAFISFCSSALSGEYIVTDINNSVENLLRILMKEYEPIVDTNVNVFKCKIQSLYQELDTDLILVLQKYRSLLFLVSDKLSNESHDYLISAFTSSKHSCSNGVLNNIIIYCFPLCLKDHFLSFEEREMQDLLLLREDSIKSLSRTNDDSPMDTIHSVLIEKCSFLLKKLVYLKGKTEYLLEFQRESIDGSDVEISHLKRCDENFKFLHVNKSYKRDKYIDEIERKCSTNSARFSEYILFMKYLSKNKCCIDQAKNLLTEFNASAKKFTPRRDFDRYAIHSLRNYMQNCYFSILLKDPKTTFETIKEELLHIDQLQKQSNILNFYPYRKAIEHLFINIEKGISLDDNDEVLLDKYNILNDCVDKYKKCVNWCSEQNYYPFQLPYKECIHHIISINTKIFIPSSFAKPLNYNLLKDEYGIYRTKLSSIDNELRLKKYSAKFLTIEDRLLKYKYDAIKILGVFTAVLTFLFGTINFFTQNNEIKPLSAKIDDTAVLGLLLMVLVSSVFLIARPSKKTGLGWSDIVSGVLILAYLFLIFKFYS